MKQAKLAFSSEEEIKNYVNECEKRYFADVKTACDIAASGGRIITLCGPSCSGKTTTALMLDLDFYKLGKELHTISIDNFYFDRDVLVERSIKANKPLDYDSPSTIDLELFGRVIADIDDGGTVTLPTFDFKDGVRTGFEDINITDSDVFLFEGIQAVYPEVTRHLRGRCYTSMFISVKEAVAYGDTVFEPRELRFLRRLVRDARTRSATAEFTFSIWESVCKNEDENIYPNIGACNVHIDSSFEYEVSVIKPFALPLLMSVSVDSAFKEKADKMIKKLENVPVIDEKYVPDGSVFREFIGERT